MEADLESTSVANVLLPFTGSSQYGIAYCRLRFFFVCNFVCNRVTMITRKQTYRHETCGIELDR